MVGPQPDRKDDVMTSLAPEEIETLHALVDTLIPTGGPGPSASQAGVVIFIARQLATDYGTGRDRFDFDVPPELAHLYWSPAEAYRFGLAGLDRLARDQHGTPFAALTEPDRDAIVVRIDSGQAGPAMAAFFELALQNTREGYFADPLHGGNRNAASWQVIGFPGCGHDYRGLVGRDAPVADGLPIRTMTGEVTA